MGLLKLKEMVCTLLFPFNFNDPSSTPKRIIQTLLMISYKCLLLQCREIIESGRAHWISTKSGRGKQTWCVIASISGINTRNQNPQEIDREDILVQKERHGRFSPKTLFSKEER